MHGYFYFLSFSLFLYFSSFFSSFAAVFSSPNGSYACGKCQPWYLSLFLFFFRFFHFLFATTSCQMEIGYVGDEVTSFLYLCTHLTYFVDINECDTDNGGRGNSTMCSAFSFSFILILSSLFLSFIFLSFLFLFFVYIILH
jgi:hypothetical protein